MKNDEIVTVIEGDSGAYISISEYHRVYRHLERIRQAVVNLVETINSREFDEPAGEWDKPTDNAHLGD